MALDMTSFNAALKQHYTQDRVENMVYPDNALLTLMPKMEKFGGSNLPIPIIYGNPQGRSATFSNALNQKTNTKVKAFTITRQHDYSLANVDNEVLEASVGNSEAFMEAATTEIDGAIQSASRSMATAMYRDGTGAISQLDASVTVSSANALILNPVDSVVNLEVGMTIQLAASAGAAPRAGSAVIVNIDRFAGTIKVSATDGGAAVAINTLIGAAAASDVILVAGDSNAKLHGLDGWLPLPGVLTSTSWFGVDRTVDSVRLGGVNYDGRGIPVEEVVTELSSRICREGGRPDYCFMNFTNWSNLEKALGSKVQYVDVNPTPQIGFTGIKIASPKGMIKVIPDQNCQGDRLYILTMDKWKVYSLGKAPRILNSDGNQFLRASSADQVEVRVGYYAEQATRAPGQSGVAQLA